MMNLEHEAVELRFGKRVRPFELNRVLCRKDEERRFERIGPSLHRDALLLHRLEQRRLSLRWRPVDFVGQQDVREDRTRHEDHVAPA